VIYDHTIKRNGKKKNNAKSKVGIDFLFFSPHSSLPLVRRGSTCGREAGHDRKWKVVGCVGDKVSHQKGKRNYYMVHVMLMFLIWLVRFIITY
jgi:hypothetical protein